jgi:hypothetical protein
MSAQSVLVPDVRGKSTGEDTPLVPALSKGPRLPKGDPVKEINSYLEYRSRDLSTLVRLLEQQRVHLRSVEAERDLAYEKFTDTVEAVHDAARSLRDSVERNGKPADQVVVAGFEKNQKALAELETMAVALRANYLNWRGAWEQYETTREKAKALRAEIAESPEY